MSKGWVEVAPRLENAVRSSLQNRLEIEQFSAARTNIIANESTNAEQTTLWGGTLRLHHPSTLDHPGLELPLKLHYHKNSIA